CPAHEIDEATADHEAQTRAAVLARDRCVGLHERLEYLVDSFCSNADSGVAHGEADGCISAGQAKVGEFCAVGIGHSDAHCATLGKFHRIAEEIDENLLDARGVAYALPACARRHAGKQVEALGGSTGSKEIDRILHEIDERKGLEVEFDSARLDLGEIEYI